MKVEVIEKEDKTKEVTYPFIGKSKKYIVLFISESTCVVLKRISDEGVHGEGFFSQSWADENFEKLGEKLILEND